MNVIQFLHHAHDITVITHYLHIFQFSNVCSRVLQFVICTSYNFRFQIIIGKILASFQKVLNFIQLNIDSVKSIELEMVQRDDGS